MCELLHPSCWLLSLPRGNAWGPLLSVQRACKVTQEEQRSLGASLLKHVEEHKVTFTVTPPACSCLPKLSAQSLGHECCHPPSNVTGKGEILQSWEGKSSLTCVPS